MDQSQLDAEHELLKRQVEALQREHDTLEGKPYDSLEHKKHKERLRLKIAELRAHMTRLKARG